MNDSSLPSQSSGGTLRRRVDQLNSLVQQQVSLILKREIEFPLETIVTVTKVKVADDAESAKVWISVLPIDNAEAALKEILRRIRDIQRVLNKRLVMKFVPKLTFRLDTAEDKADHINQVLDSLTIEDDQSDLPTKQ